MEATSGEILIDNINTKLIGLDDLRSKMSIIPQGEKKLHEMKNNNNNKILKIDPILFAGTIRSNLDPFSQHSDQKIWNALKKVKIENLVPNLESIVSEGKKKSRNRNFNDFSGGNNFSAGQKQLLCLARALLKDSKILFLDEATAVVDYQTDELIQATIRTEFSHATVITIAHRINTVMHCDRILGMSEGEVAEFENPEKLLENSSSLFSKMFQASSGRKIN